MDFINDIVDWITGIFTDEPKKQSQPSKQPQKKTVEEKTHSLPKFAKQAYNERNAPNLDVIPEDLVKFCVQWFVIAGMSLEGAVATVANLWRESYLNPHQLQLVNGNPKGPGRGLAQWSDGKAKPREKTDDELSYNEKLKEMQRWELFKKHFFPKLKESHEYWKDRDEYDPEVQLAYIVFEMRQRFPGIWRQMTSSGSLSEKTLTILQKYEVSKDRDEKSEQNYRISLAEKMYNVVKNDKKIKAIIEQGKASK